MEAGYEERENMPIESEQQDVELATEGEELKWQERADVASGSRLKRIIRKPMR